MIFNYIDGVLKSKEKEIGEELGRVCVKKTYTTKTEGKTIKKQSD